MVCRPPPLWILAIVLVGMSGIGIAVGVAAAAAAAAPLPTAGFFNGGWVVAGTSCMLRLYAGTAGGGAMTTGLDGNPVASCSKCKI